MNSIERIAVLMTSFNRRALTLRAINALQEQKGISALRFTVFLTDDGCTDGTGDAVRMQFPEAHILRGNGSLYWNGGMRMALAAALEKPFDAYLLLNDDTFLYDHALSRLVHCAEEQLAAGRPAIVVGSTRLPRTGELSYGGVALRVHGPRVALEKITPHELDTLPCDTMNGNVVLVPSAIAEKVGTLDRRFRHQFGDLDYGLRARRAGFSVIIAPGYAGQCESNSVARTWRDKTAPLAVRWKHLISPKGVPFTEWALFTRRHYGWRWLYYAVSPYVKTIVSSLWIQRGGRGLTNAPAPKQ
jgi:GT2 family glycosyltransferase